MTPRDDISKKYFLNIHEPKLFPILQLLNSCNS